MEQRQRDVVIAEGLESHIDDWLRQTVAVKHGDGGQARPRQVEAQALQGPRLHTHKPGQTNLDVLHISSLTISLHCENGRNTSPRCWSASAKNLRAKRNSG